MNEPALRIPPHSVEAEQAVIGGLLLDNDAVDRIGSLKAEHFYRFDHRQIFGVMLKMIEAGERADLVTVFVATSALPSPPPDLLSYLNAISAATPSVANIRRHAEIVRDRALRRDVITAVDEVVERAFDGKGSAREVLDEAGTKLERLAEERGTADPVRAGDVIFRHLEVVDDRTTGVTRAIATGFGDVDRRLNGGMRRGQVIVVAARPKMGKSAFALQLARHVARDHSVLFLSMEMPIAELHDRNLAAVGEIGLSSLLSPCGLRDVEWSRVSAAANEIEGLNLYLDEQGALRLLDVRLKARFVKRRHGLDMLVIDYLQLMEGSGENRNNQIEGITRGLKALAKELDVAIVLLSQLNRKLEERPDKRPTPGDLRDSGSIEQDADVVMFLYRDDVYHADSRVPGVCEVNVSLSRSGAPGRERLMYVGEQVRFESRAGSWEEPLPIAPRRARPLNMDAATT